MLSDTLWPSGGGFFSADYGGFQAFLGGIQNRLVYIQDSLFCKYPNRGAAEIKVSFFRAPFCHKSASVIMDFSYQESACFHKAELLGVNDRILSGVFQENGADFQGSGPYGMEKAGNGYLFDRQAAVRVTVAVVVVGNQTENEAEAIFVSVRQSRVMEELFQGIVRVYVQAVSFPGEKVVEGAVVFRNIGVHGDTVEPDIQDDEPPGPGGTPK